MKRVRYVFPTSHHYRLPFHERLRDLLVADGVDYKVVYSAPSKESVRKRDTVEVDWGVKVPKIVLPGTGLIWQMGLTEVARSDLTIVQQENSLLLNYVCNMASVIGAKRIAYFGHGRNFQARDGNSTAERWKRFWALRCDWWFGYTEETRQHLLALGFPAERITVFNNSVDTGAVRRLAEAVTPARLAEHRAVLDIASENVAVFVGGIYPDKRMRFMVEAAELVRESVPDFTLLVVGGGSDLPLVHELVADKPWIKVLGPRFGAEKVELMRLGKLFLMPGLLGLAVLDAAAAGLPTITTAYPWHSPEIAYLEDGVSGLMVRDWQDPRSYADAVTAMLLDRPRLNAMAAAARAMVDYYSVEAMAERFAKGVLAALAAPSR